MTIKGPLLCRHIVKKKELDKTFMNFVESRAKRNKKSIYEHIKKYIRSKNLLYNVVNIILRRGNLYKRTMLIDIPINGPYTDVRIIADHVLNEK